MSGFPTVGGRAARSPTDACGVLIGMLGLSDGSRVVKRCR